MTQPEPTPEYPRARLNAPTLFVKYLPGDIKEMDILEAFKSCKAIRVAKVKRFQDSPPGTSNARVVFPSIAQAEKALTIIRFRPIPNPKIHPPVLLDISAELNKTQSLFPSEENQRWITPLPAGYDESRLYDLLRPFGPIASLHVDKNFGGVVQFWTEDDACDAERSLAGTALSGQASPLTINAYHFRTIFCANLPIDMNETALRDEFKKFGDIISVRMPNIGKNRKFGFVSFRTSEQAFRSLKSMNGHKGILVLFEDPKMIPRDINKDQRNSQFPLTPKADENDPEAAQPRGEIPPSVASDTSPSDSNENDLKAEATQSSENQTPSVGSGTKYSFAKVVADDKDDNSIAKDASSPSDAAKPVSELELCRLRAELMSWKTEATQLREELGKARMDVELNERLRARADKENGDLKYKLEQEVEISRIRVAICEGSLLKAEREREEYKEDMEMARFSARQLKDELSRETRRTEGLCAEKDAQNEELQRRLEMAESRIKILQLERDRPLWEEAKRQREAKEREEQAKAEEEIRRAELAESQRKMRIFAREEAERKRAAEEALQARLKEERERKEREESERKEKERKERENAEQARLESLRKEREWRVATQIEENRCRKRDQDRWGKKKWSNSHAVNRFRVICEEFEANRFSAASKPLTAGSVPWPVLVDPFRFKVEDLDWKMVESFFEFFEVAFHDDYSKMVEKTHRMFHPDKWRSRGLLSTVQDDTTRKCLGDAGNVVAQALTPIWTKSKE